MKIAFIGLGNMGGGMAANLVKAGHDVRAFDLSEAALGAAKDAGCATFATAKEACTDAEAVVSMLPNGGIVKSVYEADVIGTAPEGAVFLDCSTIDVATAREVISAAEAAGYDMVDAPVSGGIAAANGGTLTATSFPVNGGRLAPLPTRDSLMPLSGSATKQTPGEPASVIIRNNGAPITNTVYTTINNPPWIMVQVQILR